MLEIIILHMLYGASIPLSKVILRFAPPIFLAGIRMTLAGIVLLGYRHLRQQPLQIPHAHLWLYAQTIFFGVYLKYVLRYWGLNYMSAAKMALLLNASPFIAALFSYLHHKEVLVRRQWFALILGFIGLIPLLLTSSPTEKLIGELYIFSWPELAIIGAMLAHCYGTITAQILLKNYQYSVSITNGIRMLGGGILALITAFIIEGSPHIIDPYTFAFWLSLLIILSNVICHQFALHLLKQYSVTFLAMTDSIGLFFSVLYGWFFLHEQITWHFFASGILMACALYLFIEPEKLMCRTTT